MNGIFAYHGKTPPGSTLLVVIKRSFEFKWHFILLIYTLRWDAFQHSSAGRISILKICQRVDRVQLNCANSSHFPLFQMDIWSAFCTVIGHKFGSGQMNPWVFEKHSIIDIRIFFDEKKSAYNFPQNDKENFKALFIGGFERWGSWWFSLDFWKHVPGWI